MFLCETIIKCLNDYCIRNVPLITSATLEQDKSAYKKHLGVQTRNCLSTLKYCYKMQLIIDKQFQTISNGPYSRSKVE